MPHNHVRNKMVLLGVLALGCTLKQGGEIQIQDVPTQIVGSVAFSSSIHLGIYCKTKELLTLASEVERLVSLNS